MKNNTGLIVLAVIVVLGLIIFFVSKNKNESAENNGTQTSQVGDDTNMEAGEDLSAGSVNATATNVSPMSYAAALAKYGTARIQFNSTCQATPNNVTYKDGQSIMLDNRSATARTLHIGSMGNVSIKAWGFKIIKLSAGGIYPNVVMVDCGVSQNVATITIQK